MAHDERRREAVPLEAVIRALQVELEAAMNASGDADLMWEVDLQVAVTTTPDEHAEIQLWVLTGDQKASHKDSSVQKVKITLTPRWRGRPDADVGLADRTPLKDGDVIHVDVGQLGRQGPHHEAVGDSDADAADAAYEDPDREY